MAPSADNDLIHVMRNHNGEKSYSPFSAAEMDRRRDAMVARMEAIGVDACLFTSYHNICYFSGFLHCSFGRRYAAVLNKDGVTTVSGALDGGRAWRVSVGDNVSYTDWRRDSYFVAVGELIGGVKRLGIEFDAVSLDLRALLETHFPGVELVDCAHEAMLIRTVKSSEEHDVIRKGAEIANIGGRAQIEAVKPGVPEYEVAIASTDAMVRAIADSYPFVELVDTWTWFQSGINTDGAHNPVTSKRVGEGEILSLNSFPMIFGYYTALERTAFYGHAPDAHLDIWKKNCEVHVRGMELLKPGARCCDVAKELNEMFEKWDLLKYRSFGYGHSFGVLCHYYGREAAVELREDTETVLQPGMVVSMEPMVTLPEGAPGEGGYREHDILIITENGGENITNFPFGPEEMILGK